MGLLTGPSDEARLTSGLEAKNANLLDERGGHEPGPAGYKDVSHPVALM
jgi:hypothetical protein